MFKIGKASMNDRLCLWIHLISEWKTSASTLCIWIVNLTGFRIISRHLCEGFYRDVYPMWKKPLWKYHHFIWLLFQNEQKGEKRWAATFIAPWSLTVGTMVLITSCSYSYAFPTRMYYTHNLWGKRERQLKNNIHFLKFNWVQFCCQEYGLSDVYIWNHVFI